MSADQDAHAYIYHNVGVELDIAASQRGHAYFYENVLEYFAQASHLMRWTGSEWVMPVLKRYTGSDWVEVTSAAEAPETPVTYFRPDDPVVYPINATYGDEMESAPLSGSWTKRNIAQAETTAAAAGMKTSGIVVTFDAQGDALTRPCPLGVDFEMVVAMEIADPSSMTGPCMLAANGSGGSYGPYNDGRIYSWNITTYNYGSTGTANAGGIPGPGLFWVRMKYLVSGGNATCMHSSNGVDWSGTVSIGVGTPTQMGIVRPFTGASTTVTIRRFNVFLGPNFYVP